VDFLAGGQNSDAVDGGPGDDTLVGDLPGPGDSPLPPTPDPEANFDLCLGASGSDTSFLCERTFSVESIN
jgi:Ca2+-binding RTX toxin-like protein